MTTAPSPERVPAPERQRSRASHLRDASARNSRMPKVALASVGLGRIQRGFERYFSDLFSVLQSEIDVTLYKSAGPPSPGERVPPLFVTLSRMTGVLPLGRVGAEYREYKHDCLAFALSMLPDLLRRDFDVVHIIDYPLERALDVLQRMFRFRARLLFTNGMGMPPQFYPRTAHVHHVAKFYYDEAVRGDIPQSRLSVIPCGIRSEQFQTTATRQELRRKYGISDKTFVILAVTALKRHHKRVDHIIEEVSRLDGDFLLWIDGKPEEPELAALAQEKLGPRCRITYVPSADVAELYGLADVMVHAALAETFGLAVVEALSAGLVVLTHDSPHFQWLIGDDAFRVDMTAPGALAERLREVVQRTDELSRNARAGAELVRRRFDWDALRSAYVDMYRRVAEFD